MEVQGSNFDEEINALKNEAAELDALYNNSKAMLQNVINSRSRGSLAFTHLQTGNLIAIKNAKISAIKGIMTLKEKKYKQELQKQLLDGGGGSFNVGELVDILSQNGVGYRPKQTIEAEVLDEEDFEAQAKEQLEKSKEVAKVSQAENEAPDFKQEAYVPPEPEADPESEGIEELVDIPVTTDEYEIVANKDGEIFVIDLTASSDAGTVLMDKDLLGIEADEKAVIDSSGIIPKAKFRGKDIEVVEIES